MNNILIISPISGIKDKLSKFIQRRYNIIDYSEFMDFDYLSSISHREKLKYLGYIIKKTEIFLAIWIPTESDKENILIKELLTVCTESEHVRSIVFDVKNFISIEGCESKIVKNGTSKVNTILKEKFDVNVNVEYLMVTGIIAFNNHLELSLCDSHGPDRKISVSLIDDIADCVFQCREKITIAFQSYTLAEIQHRLKSGLFIADCDTEEDPCNASTDRIETLLRQSACCLKPIYQSKAQDFWRTKRVASVRSEMGTKLAKHLNAKEIAGIDIVVPVPETGKYYAQGLARDIGKPFVEAIVRNQQMGRGLQIEDAAQRNIFIREKLTVIEELVKDKNVGIVDEAIFTGATLRIVVDQLKDAGANRIHLLLPTPHNVRACEYNVVPQRNVLLDYVRRADLKDYFDVDEITFTKIDDLYSSLGEQICSDCFDC